jgi:hypothetical protein
MKNGEPLIVYHGTEQKFNIFEKKYASEGGFLGKGFYFGLDRGAVERFANISEFDKEMFTDRELAEYVKPAFLSIKNDNEGIVRDGEVVVYNANQIKSAFNEGSFAIDKGGYDNTQVRTEAIPGGEGVVARKTARRQELEELGAYNVQFIEGGIKYSFDPTNMYFQDKNMSSSVASQQTVAKIKEVLNKMGVSIEDLYEYAKKNNVDVKGKNGLADLTRGVIAIANQQEGETLTEEMVHIATAMIEQTNPGLITQMISKIDRFKIYNENT